MTLDDLFDLPADVISEFSKGLTNWMNHVRKAINSGVDDLFELTDIVFFLHHPERLGRAIESWEKDAIKAWNDIRKKILKEFPCLSSTATVKISKADLEKKLDAYIQALHFSTLFLKPEILLVLRQIPDKDRRLLAIFGYIRYQYKHPGDIYDIWAWDDDEISEYKKSIEHKEAQKALRHVIKAFRADSAMKAKGCRLVVVPEPRSLRKQIIAWNSNGGVKKIGEKLRKVLLKEMRKAKYPATPNAHGIKMLHRRLTVDWKKGTLKSPTNATPGLSAHGQMRAVDFHVKKGGTKLAGAGGPQNWRDQGFDRALRGAVSQANKELGRTAFKGPLKHPDEPWHYTYVP